MELPVIHFVWLQTGRSFVTLVREDISFLLLKTLIIFKYIYVPSLISTLTHLLKAMSSWLKNHAKRNPISSAKPFFLVDPLLRTMLFAHSHIETIRRPSCNQAGKCCRLIQTVSAYSYSQARFHIQPEVRKHTWAHFPSS